MTTVADIVLAKPAAARVFERHEIDYCCHGQRPLEQACSEAGVDLDAVQAELDALLAALRSPGSAEEYAELQQRRRWCEVRKSLMTETHGARRAH